MNLWNLSFCIRSVRPNFSHSHHLEIQIFKVKVIIKIPKSRKYAEEVKQDETRTGRDIRINQTILPFSWVEQQSLRNTHKPVKVHKALQTMSKQQRASQIAAECMMIPKGSLLLEKHAVNVGVVDCYELKVPTKKPTTVQSFADSFFFHVAPFIPRVVFLCWMAHKLFYSPPSTTTPRSYGSGFFCLLEERNDKEMILDTGTTQTWMSVTPADNNKHNVSIWINCEEEKQSLDELFDTSSCKICPNLVEKCCRNRHGKGQGQQLTNTTYSSCSMFVYICELLLTGLARPRAVFFWPLLFVFPTSVLRLDLSIKKYQFMKIGICSLFGGKTKLNIQS